MASELWFLRKMQRGLWIDRKANEAAVHKAVKNYYKLIRDILCVREIRNKKNLVETVVLEVKMEKL